MAREVPPCPDPAFCRNPPDYRVSPPVAAAPVCADAGFGTRYGVKTGENAALLNRRQQSVRLRAIWSIHNPFALPAMPATSIFRVDSSIKKRTMNPCSPLWVYTSTVKKSAATISSQCRVRNSFQAVLRLRCGARSRPFFFFRIAAMVCFRCGARD